MYSWLWRHLPGPTAVKIVQCVVLAGAVVAALMLVVFPWAEQQLPFLQVTVDQAPSSGPSTPAPTPIPSPTSRR